ncbi:MAG: hypothetical protein KBS52_04095, partial [Clostridiales bacterium]|nr:hypothetical protein [Candidatus Equinaster intestinalis]
YTALAMIFCGVFTLIFIIAAGNIFDSVVSFLTVNIGLPIILLVIYECCRYFLFGFSGVTSSAVLIKYCTPFIYSGYSIAMFGSYPDEYSLFTFVSVIATLLITVLLAAACILLYNRRKSEKVANPYAFGFMPSIIGVIISVITYIIFAIIFDSLDFEIISFAGIIGALLGSIIYNAVTNRGFKKIKSSFIVAGVSIVLVLAVTLSISFDIFGYESYIPKTGEIAETEISYQGYDMRIDDPEIITALHKQVIESHKEGMDNEYFGDCEYIKVSYRLKSGRSVLRTYDVPMGVARAQKQKIINEYLPKTILDEFLSSKPQNFVFNGFAEYGGKESEFSVILTRAETQSLVNAYCEDLRSAEYDANWNKESIAENYYINYLNNGEMDGNASYYSLDVLVRKGFTKTKEFINSIDVEKRNTIDTEMELYNK